MQPSSKIFVHHSPVWKFEAGSCHTVLSLFSSYFPAGTVCSFEGSKHRLLSSSSCDCLCISTLGTHFLELASPLFILLGYLMFGFLTLVHTLIQQISVENF